MCGTAYAMACRTSAPRPSTGFFECLLEESALARMDAAVAEPIDQTEGRVRIYQLREECARRA